MTQIISFQQIKEILPKIEVLPIMESGFASYSRGDVVVPPVGELIFENPPGEAHIKYGYIKEDDFFVIKIASGFYNNPSLGLSSSQGVMLLFNQKTGQLKAVLLDDGHLTDIRTAAAGAVAAKYLAPKNVKQIGIVGTGTQAKLQLEYLRPITNCRKVICWARSESSGKQFLDYFQNSDFEITITKDLDLLTQSSNLIITTTPSKKALIKWEHLQPGTHITAMGSDTAEKIEIDPMVLGNADKVIVDSLPQSESRGEVYQAVKAGTLDRSTCVELGNLVLNPELGRMKAEEITLADLTGVAVQDIQIAKAVYLNFLKS